MCMCLMGACFFLQHSECTFAFCPELTEFGGNKCRTWKWKARPMKRRFVLFCGTSPSLSDRLSCYCATELTRALSVPNFWELGSQRRHNFYFGKRRLLRFTGQSLPLHEKSSYERSESVILADGGSFVSLCGTALRNERPRRLRRWNPFSAKRKVIAKANQFSPLLTDAVSQLVVGGWPKCPGPESTGIPVVALDMGIKFVHSHCTGL